MKNRTTQIKTAILITLTLLISATIQTNAEEDKSKPKPKTSQSKTTTKPTKTGWRKTTADIDKAGGDAGDAIDAKIDAATTKILGKKGGKIAKQGKDILTGVDTGLNIMDGVITVGEGIEEGDGAKAVSPIVGQDTSDKVSAKAGKEWAKEEGKALTAKEAEVRQALKHKLRRKGATKEEAEAAMQHYDSGDRKKFHNAVKTIKAKGIEDTDKRGLTPNAKAEEEDGIRERLYEGGKTAAKKADNFYGGIVQKQQASNKEFDELKKEQEHTQQGIQSEVDNAVIKKMMRKGVSYKDARRALDEKRAGNPARFKKITKELAASGKEDPGQKGSGLTAEGRTSTYEYGDAAEDFIDKEKQTWEDRSKKMMRPIYKGLEYSDKKDLAEKKQEEEENKIYGKLRKAGATKREARRAAKDYAKGDPEKVIKLGKKLRKRKKDDETKKIVDDLFSDDDPSEKKNNKNLKDNEYDNDYVDVPDKQKDLSAEMILRKELARQKENAFSAEVNKAKNDMAKASTSGDASVRDSQAKIDQAHTEGESIKTAATDKSNADYQDNSFGEQMSGEITEGIKQGMETAGTAVGTAIGQAMARKILGDKHKEDRREEIIEEENSAVAANNDPSGSAPAAASPSSPQISGGRSSQQASSGIIKQTSGGKPVSTGGKAPAQTVKPVSTATAGAHKCEYCSLPGTYSNDGKYYYCKNHVMYMPAKKTTEPAIAKPKPAPAPTGWKCPSCGSHDTKFKHSHSLYGDVYHCNGCGGTVHNI